MIQLNKYWVSGVLTFGIPLIFLWSLNLSLWVSGVPSAPEVFLPPVAFLSLLLIVLLWVCTLSDLSGLYKLEGRVPGWSLNLGWVATLFLAILSQTLISIAFYLFLFLGGLGDWIPLEITRRRVVGVSLPLGIILSCVVFLIAESRQGRLFGLPTLRVAKEAYNENETE